MGQCISRQSDQRNRLESPEMDYVVYVKSQFNRGNGCPLIALRQLGFQMGGKVCSSKVKRRQGKTQNGRKSTQYICLPEDLYSD